MMQGLSLSKGSRAPGGSAGAGLINQHTPYLHYPPSPSNHTPPEPLKTAYHDAPGAGQWPPPLHLKVPCRNSSLSSQTKCIFPQGWLLIRCHHLSLVWVPLRCKRCAGCRNHKRRRNIAKVRFGLENQADIAFITLTSLPKTTWPALMKRWSQLLPWLRRRMPGLQFACAKEEGPNTGMKHLHIAAFGWLYLPHAELSSQWEKYTGAWVVDIRRAEGPSVAAYIAKHFAKTVPVSRKAMSFSKGWPRQPPPTILHLVDKCWHPPANLEPLDVATDGSLLEFRAPGCDCFARIFPVYHERFERSYPP